MSAENMKSNFMCQPLNHVNNNDALIICISRAKLAPYLSGIKIVYELKLSFCSLLFTMFPELLKSLYYATGGVSDKRELHKCRSLTHLNLASHLWDIDKQYSPRWDAAGLFCLLRAISSKME